MNYKLAFALGLIAPGTVGREPVAYLYNGIRLPALPEWDREKYPYAVIIDASPLFIVFKVVDIAPEVDASISFDPSLSSDANYIQWRYDDETNTWGSMETGQVGSSGSLFSTIWTNTDLYNADGSVFLAASDPIPVYE